MTQINSFQTKDVKNTFAMLYGPVAGDAPERYQFIHNEFMKYYGQGDYRIFSAPGRCEIGGNHTDHNYGRVLTCAVSVDTVAFVRKREDNRINLRSYGYDREFQIDLGNLYVVNDEKGTTEAIIRGVAAAMDREGLALCGFDAYVHSTVLGGSGLSSSAAFEVLVLAIISGLTGQDIDPVQRAIMAQYAENVYFGKPSGLLDQTASSVGGLTTIDFENPASPKVKKLDFDLSQTDYRLVVVNTGGDHGDLIDHYASIPKEMGEVAACFGVEKLRQLDEKVFYEQLDKIKGEVSDRAILRAVHFFSEDARVVEQVDALEQGDMQSFLDGIIASGDSSYKYLQNIYAFENEQSISLALALSEKILKGQGAWRVHGGGFAGTILAFVPLHMLDEYAGYMDKIFGEGASTVLSIRGCGPIEIKL